MFISECLAFIDFENNENVFLSAIYLSSIYCSATSLIIYCITFSNILDKV